ncbi:MAG: hypothetical protein ABIK12_16985 [Pseudomonadota bacterium]
MLETIRRGTIKRLGPEGYAKLMEHARQRTPEYRTEQKMKEVSADSEAWKKRQKQFKTKAAVGRPRRDRDTSGKEDKATASAKSHDAKNRQKELEQKAKTQQAREAETPPPDAGNWGKRCRT